MKSSTKVFLALYGSLHFFFKDLGHLACQSAYWQRIFWACGIIAHILTLQFYVRIFWIDPFTCNPEPSGSVKIPIQVNRWILHVQGSYRLQMRRGLILLCLIGIYTTLSEKML